MIIAIRGHGALGPNCMISYQYFQICSIIAHMKIHQNKFNFMKSCINVIFIPKKCNWH